jgi:hypothetical protein
MQNKKFPEKVFIIKENEGQEDEWFNVDENISNLVNTMKPIFVAEYQLIGMKKVFLEIKEELVVKNAG